MKLSILRTVLMIVTVDKKIKCTHLNLSLPVVALEKFTSFKTDGSSQNYVHYLARVSIHVSAISNLKLLEHLLSVTESCDRAYLRRSL